MLPLNGPTVGTRFGSASTRVQKVRPWPRLTLAISRPVHSWTLKTSGLESFRWDRMESCLSGLIHSLRWVHPRDQCYLRSESPVWVTPESQRFGCPITPRQILPLITDL